LPQTIRFDHGPEFVSLRMLKWVAEHQVDLHFIDPGKPRQNGLVESLNGRVRDELLSMTRTGLHPRTCFVTVRKLRWQR
jgi:putative transposase